MALKVPDFVGSVLNPILNTHGPGQTGSEDADSVPWTFNQILLPIILVLTFVILTQIVGYKRLYYQLQGVVLEEASKSRHTILILNYQLQKLLRALEEAKAVTRMEYHTVWFPDASKIECTGNMVNDSRFRSYCQKIYDLTDDEKFKGEVFQLYRQVLQRSGIKDQEPDRLFDMGDFHVDVREHKIGDLRDMSENEFAKTMTMDVDIIHPRNRLMIRAHIVDFFHGLVRSAETVQYELLRRLFDQVLNDPGSIPFSDHCRALVERMISSGTSVDEGDRLANQIMQETVQEWKAIFSTRHYPIVESVWDALKL